MGLYVQHSMALRKLDKEDADAEEDASQPHCLQHGLRVTPLWPTRSSKPATSERCLEQILVGV